MQNAALVHDISLLHPIITETYTIQIYALGKWCDAVSDLASRDEATKLLVEWSKATRLRTRIIKIITQIEEVVCI